MKPVNRIQPVAQPRPPDRPVPPSTAPGSQHGRKHGGVPGGTGVSSDSLPLVEWALSPELVPPSGRHEDQGDSEGQGQRNQQEGSGAAPSDDDPARTAVAELGGLIAAFCLHPSAADAQWSIRIPLDAPALPDCVLHLHFTRQALSLRFETRDWDTRAALDRYSDDLVRQLREHLPGLPEIAVQD